MALLAACGSDVTSPPTPPGVVQLTASQVSSLDSAVQVAADNNPENQELRALLDSAVDVLAAGVQARRVDVNTDLTTSALMFVGIHRAYTASGGSSSSTWTVVGFDEPAHLSTLIDLGGFAQSPTAPPNSASGSIGGDGVGNARFFRLAQGGTTTDWIVSSGTESFVADSTTPGDACPGFAPTPHVTCTTETLHVDFDLVAAGSTDGTEGARHASVATDVDIPTMRLDYKF
jgi:hypothetical protein